MSSDRQETVSRLLEQVREGRQEAIDDLFPLVYQELQILARRQRKAWLGNDTLDTTALVHEAYLKLVGRNHGSWETEAHFLAAVARAMRHVLINYARERRARKRGGGWRQVPLDDGALEKPLPGSDPVSWEDRVLVLHDALQRLADRSDRQSRVVECRFFGGMTVQQTAEALGLSTATVTRSWSMARAWLHRELGGRYGGAVAK